MIAVAGLCGQSAWSSPLRVESIGEDALPRQRVSGNKMLSWLLLGVLPMAVGTSINPADVHRVHLIQASGVEGTQRSLLTPFLFRQANQMIGDATQATELRAGSGPNEVLARVRDMGSEVCLLVLTEEDGQYLWDDINSAAVDEFQSMALIE